MHQDDGNTESCFKTTYTKTEQLDKEVGHRSAKLIQKSKDGGTRRVLCELLITRQSAFSEIWPQLLLLLGSVKGQQLTTTRTET